MADQCPDSAVKVWFPADLPNHKLCDRALVTPAHALAIVLNIIQDVDHHRIHYHIRNEDEGLVLTEFVLAPETKSGERPFGLREEIHYHGVYVDLETAKHLTATIKSHQHGVE